MHIFGYELLNLSLEVDAKHCHLYNKLKNILM